EVGIDYRVPHIARHARQRAVTGDPCIVHQDFDRADLPGNLADGLLAPFEVADIEAEDGNAGLLAEGAGSLLIAGIGGDHGAALRLQRPADLRPNATSAASYECNACHPVRPPVWLWGGHRSMLNGRRHGR